MIVSVAVGALALPASAGVRVVFRDPAKHGDDLLYVHGRLPATDSIPTPGRDIATYGATWELWKYASDTDCTGTLVYSTTLAPGACVDRGNSCKYKDPAAAEARLGLAYVKVQYKTGKTWMRSYGDLQGADTARLGFKITINSPLTPTYEHVAKFRHRHWGWQLSDKCWSGCP